MKQRYAFNNIKHLYLSLLPAQIFSFVTSSLSGIVNGLVIGNYLSNLDMIALGFVSPLVQIVSVFSTIVSSGARIVCGKYIGRGDNKRINQTFTTTITVLICFGLLLTILGLTCSIPIAKIIANVETTERTAAYIKGLSIGMLPTTLIPCLMVFLQMRNENTYALISTLLLAVSNLIICLAVIEYIGLDIFGIGLVTSISQFITLGFIIIRFYMVKTLPRFEKCTEKLLRDIMIFGLPTALSSLLYGFRNGILLKLASSVYGVAAVNALSILNSSCGPFDAVNIGVGATALMLASIYIGEKDSDSLIILSKVAITIGIIICSIKTIFIYFFAGDIARLFGATAGVVKEMTSNLYIAYGLCMPLNVIPLVIINTYQAFGKITYCNVILLFTTMIFPLSFAYFGKALIGINSIWYCYTAAEIFIFIFIYVIACCVKKRLITNLEDLLILDNKIKVGKHISISIKTMDEVINVSKRVQDYCLSEKIDKNRSYISGLCVEEIAANIIEHGFTKSKKKNNEIDIFVDVDKGNVKIRIKDNAVAFDPHIKINNEDPTTNIGIKMVSKLAKEMNYQNDFGLNVLIISI